MRYLLAVLVLVLASQGLKAQTFPLLDSNALWAVIGDASSDVFYVLGDSTIGGKEYKKLYRSRDTTATGGNAVTLIREDSLAQQVFTRRITTWSSDTLEALLYDFSLDSGDVTTVYPRNFGWGPITVTIATVDSVIVDGLLRKRLAIQAWGGPFAEFWIEGIGSNYGVLGSGLSGFSITDVYYPFLNCYKLNSETIWMGPFRTECFPNYVGLASSPAESSLAVFPNPVQRYLTLSYDYELLRCLVYDGLGKLIIEQVCTGQETRLDFSLLADGLYYVSIVTEMGVEGRRIVKRG